MIEKRWHILPDRTEAAQALAGPLGLTPIATRVLLNRGMDEVERARAFLNPQLSDLRDPSLLPGMEKAAEQIVAAARAGRSIVIYGDYDADGITATAILLRCLSLLKAEVGYYVPDRLEEGYGLHADAVRKLAEAGTNLLVTVDCGISAVDEVALAREMGMEAIITDHHEPGDRLPVGAVLIDPKQAGCDYPFRELSGAGLAFKLAWAIGKAASPGDRVRPEFRDFLLDAVSLAAVGTVADVVPLVDENRTLVHFGLKGLSASAAPGLIALRESANHTGKVVSSHEVAFRLAPRLNAAGRMGSAREAVELLITGSLERAREIAEHLGRENGRRQRLQERILNEANEMLEAEGGVEGRWSIVLAREGWHAGVLGIVAAKLAEAHRRPALLLCAEGGECHGSARALAPLHLFNVLHDCAPLLTTFGGHARAAGLRLRCDRLEAFKADFEERVGRCLHAQDLTPVLEIDAEVRLRDITRPMLDDIERLSPFGEGNAEPLLACFDVALPAGTRRMGTGGRHMSFYARQNGAAVRAVAFGMGGVADDLERAGRCSLVFVPRISRFRGAEQIELDVRDIKIG